jgi:undecaprenyl diphosphate synthase|tara:strand:- start:918 stop:1643 length:726 start_codon:yes stop_codon:yes gene_type:complete
MTNKIKNESLPKHIAVIMDGNGRWAKSKGKARIFGHRNGIKAVRETVEGAAEIGIQFLTLYAFSVENWKRPKKEVNALMSLLVTAINNEMQRLIKNNIKLTVIGETDNLPSKTQKELMDAINSTKNNTKMTLTLALSYSGKWDILNAVKKIINDKIDPKSINENIFQQYLTTKNVPYPELLIRTSGEHRISNFLLWEIAYSELYFTDTLWPDFRKKHLTKAIIEYQNRERRFGKTTEQIEN